VARRLAGHGAVLIDADVAARAVIAPGTPGFLRVTAAFGVLTPDGTIDRERLAAIVFADPERRAELNAIVHPLVGEWMAAAEAAAPPDSIVVHDVPLLAENGLAKAYDLVIVVDVPPGVQLARLVRRGMRPNDARKRMAAQAGGEQRLAIADIVIDNSGTLADLDKRTGEVWAELDQRAAVKGTDHGV
jgi:dephospho-CoA kinase